MDFAIAYIDRYHQEDPLFLRGLAWALKSEHAQTPPFILVHGSGERVERQLEAEGLIPARNDGVLMAASELERALIERSIRETNQKMVAVLTDQLISSVGIQGTDRNLLRIKEDGELEVGAITWIKHLAEKRIVPVISALAVDQPTNRIVEVDVARMLGALSLSSSPREPMSVVFFSKTDHAQVKHEKIAQDRVLLGEINGHPSNPEPATLQRVADLGVPVVLTNAVGFTRHLYTQVG